MPPKLLKQIPLTETLLSQNWFVQQSPFSIEYYIIGSV